MLCIRRHEVMSIYAAAKVHKLARIGGECLGKSERLIAIVRDDNLMKMKSR